MLTGSKDRGANPPECIQGYAVQREKPWGPECPVKTMKPDKSGERSEAVSNDYQLARVALFLSTLEIRGPAGTINAGP